MKRQGNLYPQITDFSNLLSAAKKAQKGRRYRENILKFNYNLEQELHNIKKDLEAHTYQPGPYKTFEIKQPKQRLISAAPYRDRVVHHALCNIIVPLFERTFISDSYANRVGFGTHKALDRFTQFARSSDYVLQCDIKKYFASIDHAILKELIRQKIKCKDTLWLIDTLIDNSNTQELVVGHFPGDDLMAPLQRRKGLPIGNLTSQCMANIMLNGFDHFVKEQLKISKYLRYVDDFALFSDDPDRLRDARLSIEDYLATLRLKIHPIKSQCFKTSHGANFLGFRIFRDRIRIRSENLKRARQRFQQLQQDYHHGLIELTDVIQSLQSWEAHANYGDTWHLKQQIFTALVFTRT